MRHALPILAIAATLLSGQGASAQPTQRSIDTMLGLRVSPGLTLGRYLEMHRGQFGRLDIDGDGAVTAADEELDRARAAAVNRAAAIHGILQFDLDGDGVVTREEVADAFEVRIAMMPVDRSRPDFKKQFDGEIDKQMKADANGDNRIDGAEMMAFARQQPPSPYGMATSNGMIPVALTLDDDHDGRTTEAELIKGAEAFFRRIDTDGDGTISREENLAFRRSIQGPPPTPPAQPAPR